MFLFNISSIFTGDCTGLATCVDSGQCIPKRWICDELTHCEDRSDEQHCGKNLVTRQKHLKESSEMLIYIYCVLECGVASGSDVRFPWIVKILIDSRVLCSGVLVASNYVLVQASCVENM